MLLFHAITGQTRQNSPLKRRYRCVLCTHRLPRNPMVSQITLDSLQTPLALHAPVALQGGGEHRVSERSQVTHLHFHCCILLSKAMYKSTVQRKIKDWLVTMVPPCLTLAPGSPSPSGPLGPVTPWDPWSPCNTNPPLVIICCT